MVAAVKARAAIARGRYADAETALRPVAMRVPASVAALELGLLAQMLGRADATPILQTRGRGGVRSSRRRPRAARLGQFDEANGVFRDAVARAPKDPEVNTAWGELYLDAHQKADALELFQAALEGDAEVDAGASRRRAGAGPTTIRRRRWRRPRRRSSSTRRTSRRTCSSPTRRWIRISKDEARAAAAEGARRQSVEPRGACRPGRDGLRRGQDGRLRRRGRQGAGDLAEATARCTASPAS